MKPDDNVRFKEGLRPRVTSKVRPDEIGEVTGTMVHPLGDGRLLVHVRFPLRDVASVYFLIGAAVRRRQARA